MKTDLSIPGLPQKHLWASRSEDYSMNLPNSFIYLNAQLQPELKKQL